MTRVLIFGGGGMIGQKVAHRLNEKGLVGRPVTDLTLFDLRFPADGAQCTHRIVGNLSDRDSIDSLMAKRPDVIMHLAAIVSSDAERNFHKGWQVNLFALWTLLDSLRIEHVASAGRYRPRLIFASSAAAFGPPFDGPVSDRFICEPRTSYGAQKVAAELIVSDFARKGFVDGVSLRLPTICVRPGLPNAAASSCFSDIIREPLNGREAVLPISRTVRHMLASPRSAAGFFVHAAELDLARLEGRRVLNMPSLSCSIGDQIEALRDIAGNDIVELIREVPDPFIESIVSNWATEFSTERADSLGFRAEDDFRQIIQAYIEDDLPIAAR